MRAGRGNNSDGPRKIKYEDFRGSERESHAMLAHNIGTVIKNKCPIEWSSWKKVLDELKKSMLDDLSLSGTILI